jgi:hypothetical protein
MPSGNTQFALIDQPQETVALHEDREAVERQKQNSRLPAAGSSLSKQIVARYEQIVFKPRKETVKK